MARPDIQQVAANCGELKERDYAHTEAHLSDSHPTGQTGLVASPIRRNRRPAKAAAERSKRT
jgi:hypothetical protein